jgi:hypothetical protein
LHDYTLFPLVPLSKFTLEACWIGPVLPGKFVFYPYRDLPLLKSPITPLYTIANSGPKLEGHNLNSLVDQYCTSGENISPPLPSDIQGIEEQVTLTKSIWGLIQGATNRAAAWGLSETAKQRK